MNIQIIRRVLFVIIVILVGSIAWLSYQAFRVTEESQTSPLSGPLVRNAFYPSPDENGNLRYYNGDTFVFRDTATNTIKPLTTVRGLTDLTRVSWVNEGVVFSVGAAAEWHPVWKQYDTYISQRDGDGEQFSYADDDTLANFHWYLSFKDNTLSLMSVGVDNALLYGTITESGGYFFRDFPYYSLLKPDGTIEKSIASLPSEDNERRVIKVTEKEYFYVAEKGDAVVVMSHDFATNKDTELVGSLYDSKDQSLYEQVVMAGNIIYYLEPTGTGSVSSVHSLDITTKQKKKIIDNFQGVFRQISPSIITAVHIGNEQTKLYTLNDLSMTKTVNNSHIKPAIVIPLGNDLYTITNNGYVYHIGAGATVRSDIALEKKIDLGDDFELSRNIESMNDNSYTVTFATGKYTDRMNQVYKAVSDAGYNPFEFSFAPNPGPRVQY
jgi:hypothetical protein